MGSTSSFYYTKTFIAFNYFLLNFYLKKLRKGLTGRGILYAINIPCVIIQRLTKLARKIHDKTQKNLKYNENKFCKAYGQSFAGTFEHEY